MKSLHSIYNINMLWKNLRQEFCIKNNEWYVIIKGIDSLKSFFLSASKDMTAKIYSLNPIENFIPITLTGHRDYVIGAYFSENQDLVSWFNYILKKKYIANNDNN